MIQGEDHEDEILTKKILMTRKTRWKTRRKTLTQTEDLAADPTGDPDHVPSFDLTEKIKPTMWLIMEAGQASEVEDIEDNFVAAETKVAKTKVVMTSSMTRQVIEDNVVAAETKVAKTKAVETSSMTEDRAKNLDQRFLEAGPEATEDPDRPVRRPQTWRGGGDGVGDRDTPREPGGGCGAFRDRRQTCPRPKEPKDEEAFRQNDQKTPNFAEATRQQ